MRVNTQHFQLAATEIAYSYDSPKYILIIVYLVLVEGCPGLALAQAEAGVQLGVEPQRAVLGDGGRGGEGRVHARTDKIINISSLSIQRKP